MSVDLDGLNHFSRQAVVVLVRGLDDSLHGIDILKNLASLFCAQKFFDGGDKALSDGRGQVFSKHKGVVGNFFGDGDDFDFFLYVGKLGFDSCSGIADFTLFRGGGVVGRPGGNLFLVDHGHHVVVFSGKGGVAQVHAGIFEHFEGKQVPRSGRGVGIGKFEAPQVLQGFDFGIGVGQDLPLVVVVPVADHPEQGPRPVFFMRHQVAEGIDHADVGPARAKGLHHGDVVGGDAAFEKQPRLPLQKAQQNVRVRGDAVGIDGGGEVQFDRVVSGTQFALLKTAGKQHQ